MAACQIEDKKIENTYGSCMEIVFGNLYGSILKQLLFNIFSADLSFIKSNIDIASYADDNTACIDADSIDDLIKSLKKRPLPYSNGVIIS